MIKALSGMILNLVFLSFVGLNIGIAQEEDVSEQQFVQLGYYISVNKESDVSPDNTGVIFEIKNIATRSVFKIYSWIYEVEEKDGEEGVFSNIKLVNNPNRGGALLGNETFHPPNEKRKWKFPFKEGYVPPKNTRFNFLFAVKDVFFTNFERAESK